MSKTTGSKVESTAQSSAAAASGGVPGAVIDSYAVDHRLASTLELIHEGFFALDNEWRYVHLNRKALEVGNSTLNELVGRNIWEAYPHYVGTKWEEEFRAAKSTGQPRHFISQNRIGWFEVDVYPTEDGLSVFGRDISDRKRLEDELYFSAAQLGIITNTVPALIAYIDSDKRYQFVNDRYPEWFGMATNQIIGKTVAEVVGADGYESIQPYIDQVLAGQSVTFERSVPKANGGIRHVEINYVPQFSEVDGSPMVRGYVALIQDVTEHKRIMEGLRFLSRASELMSSSLDYERTLKELAQLAVPDMGDWCAIDMVKPGGSGIRRLYTAHTDPAKLAWANELLKQYGPDTNPDSGVMRVIRTGVSQLIPLITEEMIRTLAKPEQIEHLLAFGLKSAMTVPLKSRGNVLGAITLVSTDSGRHYDQNDLALMEDLARRASNAIENAMLYRTAQEDIGHRMEAEKRMREAIESAEAANKAKDNFLAVLSHELRTPLTPILATAEILDSSEYLHGELRPHVATIRRNVELEARLIDDLLDITRISRGKLQLNLRSVDVHSIIHTVLEICKSELEANRLSVQHILDATAVTVKADPARLQQVFWNIINNATKFSSKGGRLIIRSRNIDDAIEIEIEDNGIGIEKDVLGRIFDPFEQGATTAGNNTNNHNVRKSGGLGLGLAISKDLAEMHGGSIRAESEGKGRGAKVTVTLPVSKRVAIEVQPAKTKKKDGAKSVPDTIRKELLLVDDHADTRMALKVLLERRGYSVATAPSVNDALKLVEQNTYDLLISDIGLPDGTGIDLVRQIHTTTQLPAIAMSGYCTEEDIRKSKEAGFTEHLTKPVSFPLLESIVKKILTSE